MLTTPGDLPSSEDGAWAFEVKWDGMRALAATEGGRVRLQADSPSGDLRLTIEDDGPGVPAGIAPYIFHSGFSPCAGSGLGLALARDTLTAVS